MLQRQLYSEHDGVEGGDGGTLTLSHLFDIARRRVLHFIVPFVLVLAAGSFLAVAWPAKYLSQGTILVSSQEQGGRGPARDARIR